MKHACLPFYTLTAGETRKLSIPLYTSSNQQIDATGMAARLAISDFINRGGEPFLIKDCTIKPDGSSAFGMLYVELDPQDTIDLCGKCIYQITAKDPENSFGVLQGDLLIRQNIDKGAINM